MKIIGPKAYIHLDRLRNNLNIIKQEVRNIPLMCVIKADAYGHGAKIISEVIANEDRNILFAVFSIDEALELRDSGIENDILIFSCLQENWLDISFELNLIVTASRLDDLVLLSKLYQIKGYCPRFHLNFDTGMTRLGFSLSDLNKVFTFLQRNLYLPYEGIYTHFATSEEIDSQYSLYQLEVFNRIIDHAKQKNVIFKYIHCSNSGAVLNISRAYFNLVRVGMLIYGVPPSNDIKFSIDLAPVMSFCAPVVNLRRIKAGTKVSYGCDYSAKVDTNIGVIQMGFADGFPREWYKNGYVMYKGSKYKIAGRPCMDQFMVDFGNCSPKIGDDVLIFGSNQGNLLPLEEIARDIGTTTYTLLTGIHGRTQRIPT